MIDLVNELKQCFSNKLYRIALNTALTIPDVCSALQSPSGKTKDNKYIAWFNKYVSPKYGLPVSGESIYKLRCASLHQGKLNHDYPDFEKILFQLPSPDNNIIVCGRLDGALLLNLKIFIDNIIIGYEQWEIDNNNNEYLPINLDKMIKLRQDGLMPYIGGWPILC